MNDFSRAWIVTDSKDNATATATKAAAATGNIYCLDMVAASFKTDPSVPVLLTVKDGNTVIFSYYVRNAVNIPLYGVMCTKGNAVSAVLAASGTGGNYGEVALVGHIK
jgi:hypothetical protein